MKAGSIIEIVNDIVNPQLENNLRKLLILKNIKALKFLRKENGSIYEPVPCYNINEQKMDHVPFVIIKKYIKRTIVSL